MAEAIEYTNWSDTPVTVGDKQRGGRMKNRRAVTVFVAATLMAVAPSDPNVIYVGSGEGIARPDLSVGDGIYKSTDAGKTWTHLGLRNGQQIPYIVVDPRNANRLFVAVLGHPYGPNEERGVFRSTDGGATFQKVLSKDENTGASDLEFDPGNPD